MIELKAIINRPQCGFAKAGQMPPLDQQAW